MNRRLTLIVLPLAALVGVGFLQWANAGQPMSDPLAEGFRNPPEEAKPRTWWHWTSGNVTKEGITKDLEWMKRVGIGGFQLADVASGSGQIVEKKVVYGTSEWLDAVRHAAAEADRLGLEMAIFSSPGWSITGGPWVQPQQAMKKLVWSELELAGPLKFRGNLPNPPSVNGPIRDLVRGGARPGAQPDPTWYGDAAVLAFPVPEGEGVSAALKPEVRSHSGPLNGAALLDDDLNTEIAVASAEDGRAWVQYEFPHPIPARAVTVAGRNGIPFGRLSASDDGTEFRVLVTLPGAQLYRGGTVRTFSFPETQARIFRLELTGAPMRPATVISQDPPQPAREYVLSEFKIHSGARAHRWEEKAGFSFLFEYDSVPTPPVSPNAAIPLGAFVNLTSRLKPDGSLEWDVPPGKWRILRLGYSLTGSKNRPAVPPALGYEADKLSRKHMEAYFHGFFHPIEQALGPLAGKSLRYLLVDSWEAGTQNWSEDLAADFRRLRGYDPTPYLPALAGYVVQSADVTDRFLWDFRRTLADLFAENHYGVLTELAHRHGLGTYSEASGVSLEIPEDTLLNKSKVDIPMGEFWMRALHPESMYFVDVRGAASAAHIYGKRFVAAEAFTGGGYESPYSLKKVADYWFAQGINRIVFHTSAHQPLDTKPGNTMVGTHIHRNITWAEQALPFMTYLARISFLLQQGVFCADLAYLLDEGAPSTMPFWGAGLRPAPPKGYDYDYLNADALLRRATVTAEGRISLEGGMNYRILVLPENRRMSLRVLRKVRELVAGGATVVGPKPLGSPSLEGYPESDREVRAIAEEVWGDLDGVSRTRRAYGKGEVFWGAAWEQVLPLLKLPPDLEYGQPLDSSIAWIHRRAGDAEIYYLASVSDRPVKTEVRFRVSGKHAELWHPDTGDQESADYSVDGQSTTVRLSLEPRQSLFVVFRGPARPKPGGVSRQVSVLSTLEGPWQLSFPPGLGAPDSLTLPALIAWTAAPDEGVKWFSGTAVYRKAVPARSEWLRGGARVLLDLGDVRDLAEVLVNGRTAGVLWKPPYQADVTAALRPGDNQLEIRVTNEWTNRIMGDRLSPPDRRILSLPAPAGPGGGMFGRPQSPPESGLLGPVRLLSITPSQATRE